jgi:hypothetical protein
VIRSRLIILAILLGLIASANRLDAQENAKSDFRSVLEIAGLGPDRLADFTGRPDYSNEDWQLLVQLLSRLRQSSVEQLASWAESWDEASEFEVGGLSQVAGKVVSVEIVMLPEEFAKLLKRSKLYRCTVRLEKNEAELEVLSSRVPKCWADRDLTIGEQVRWRGILLKKSEGEKRSAAILLTDRLAWFPIQHVPSGQALLARHGMDIALLDEVVQRRPFVKPSVSREGDAFYACLATIKKVDSKELAELAQHNVATVAKKWQQQRESLAKQRQVLKEKESTGANDTQSKLHAKRVKKIGQQLALADAVLERGEVGTSSVAPLFLQPELEVGELVRLEGIARRAVWIAESDRPEVESYCELEIFPPDSQDLPIVCCVTRLPPGFPIGDEIREPVRISGIFFKSWQYRSRKLLETGGETKRQQRLYTPIVVAAGPIWLTDAGQGSRWGLWGGIAFLAVLVVLWINMARQSRRDRNARAVSRQTIEVESPTPTLSGDDFPEVKT